MKRGFLIFILSLIIGGYIISCAFAESFDDGFCYTNFSKKELLKDLCFCEKQVFKKIYNSDTMLERLERLEIEVYGALQDGNEDYRIKKLRKSVTNIASGGNGLNYASRAFNLAGNALGMTNWAIGNMHSYYPNIGTNNFSNRYIPHKRAFSHRLPPPPNMHNYNPYTNVDFSKNYSLGTSVKILDD